MAGMTWLHLSDWHQRGKDFDRDVVRDALLEDIRNRAAIHADLAKIDFVIFSGDVAFSGQSEEYQVALKQLFTPLLKATGLRRSRFFFVAGNHDFDEGELNYLPDDIRQTFTIEAQVQGWLTDSKKRNHMLKPFMAYTDFVREFTGQDQPAYASIRSFAVDGKQVALLGLNSALMCRRNKDAKGEVNDQSFLIVGEPQLYEPLKKIAKTKIRIAVLHHPFDWLTDFDRDRVENSLIQNCHFILCGHLHKPNVIVQRGIAGASVIIPAGASYDRRIAPNPRYANSYNFVHLDFETEQGTIYLRRWSDPRGRWIEDVDSCTDGVFQFPFPESLRNSLSLSAVAPIISMATGHTKDVHEQDLTPSSESKDSQPQISEAHNVTGGRTSSSRTRSSQQNGQTTSVPPIPNKVYTFQFPPSENFLEEVRECITEAQGYVQNAAAPFKGQGYIWQRAYIEASKLFEKAKMYLQAMHEFLDKVVSIAETSLKYPKLVVNYHDIVNQIYEIESELDSLISYIEDEQPQREDITGSASSLVQQLKSLNQSIWGENISHSST